MTAYRVECYTQNAESCVIKISCKSKIERDMTIHRLNIEGVSGQQLIDL